MSEERLVEILGFNPETAKRPEDSLQRMRLVSEKQDIQPKFSVAYLAKARREGNFQLETILEDEKHLFLIERSFGYDVSRIYLERFWKPGLPFKIVAEAGIKLKAGGIFPFDRDGEGYHPWFLKFSTTQNDDEVELRPWGNELDCELYFDDRLVSIDYDTYGRLDLVSVTSHESLYDDLSPFSLKLGRKDIDELVESGEIKEYKYKRPKIKRKKSNLELMHPDVDFDNLVRDEYQVQRLNSLLEIRRIREGIVKDVLQISLETHGEQVMNRLLGQALVDDPLNYSISADDSWRDFTPEQVLPIIGVTNWERF